MRLEQLIEFKKVSLDPSIQAFDLKIPAKSWVVLDGPDTLGIALFCDLCFGFLEPDSGEVKSPFTSADVSFLGRAPTTYGRTLLEHITAGARRAPKGEVLNATKSALSADFQARFPGDPGALLRYSVAILDLELNERDFLELSEANSLLQARPFQVIDTTSEFYQLALEQGFRHSEKFLESSRAIFWIVDERIAYPADARPWGAAKAAEENAPLLIYFEKLSRKTVTN